MGVLRKRVLLRVLLGLIATIASLALIASLLGVWAVRRSFPTTSGELSLSELSAPVTVLRDEQGVAHVYSDNAEDLFVAQGFTHAQDRFWEMDFRRHVTAGRTAELFGEGQVETDIYLRTMGWRRVAEQEYDLLEEDTQRYLDAYAAGVNAWIDDNQGLEAGLEYGLLGITADDYTVEPWTPTDSLAWLKAMAWDLGGNLQAETERAQLLAKGLDEDMIEELYPAYPTDLHSPITDTDEHDGDDPEADLGRAPELPEEALAALDGFSDVHAAIPDLLGPSSSPDLGSNSWVVSGEHTETGAPLLTNDPHLGASMPSTWYQMGLHCTELTEACPFDVSGFSFSGLPGVIIGQNESIAWGFTNLNPDVMDLYLEQVDGDTYVVDGEELPLEIIEETIAVSGGDDLDLTVRSTHRGPLLSTTAAGAGLREIGENPGEGDDAPYQVSLRWTALQPGSAADAIFDMNQARDWEGFREAAGKFDVPSQNLVYADNEGNIGYQSPGLVPVRGEGDGRWPAPGWVSDYDWEEEYLPFDELPSVLNPESGVIVTANQSVVDEDYEHFLTTDWDYGYRSQRINDLLDEAIADGPLTVADMERVLMDSHHGAAVEITPYLLDAEVDGTTAEAQALLEDWDHFNEPDSAGAAFYNATWRHLLPLLFDELGELDMNSSSRGMYVVAQLLEDPDNAWWEGGEADGREEVLAAAMDEAAEELTELLGDTPADWRWGDLHTLTATHESFGTSGIGPVEWLFNRGPVESSGGSSIVNATGWNAAEGYGITAVPSMRMIVDLSDRDSSRWIHLTGNSGHAFHPNYDDQLELWAEGETLPWAVTEDAVREASTDELTLVP
ncbi:penicillin acylase family protein [Nocardiopsis ganjiahuensis]|uniref:penicillin acylase family protein n=1 Tax=Nocardiopsis ganjiahuensis TaxID=239984 RepID=UPI000348C5E2|nr:penicillin acylase family protein [Nocardiopsis ganjiahuensis]